MQIVDTMERAQDAKLDELQRVRQLNLALRSRLTTLDEKLKRKVGVSLIIQRLIPKYGMAVI